MTARKLEGRRALVVGAASGIGRGIARRFAAEGAEVVVADIDAGGAMTVAREIEAGGGAASVRVVDVADADSVAGLLDVEPDVLAHAPAVGTPAPVADMPLEEWNRVVAVNLTGPFLVTRAVLPGMIDRGSGRIVIVGSQLAFIGAAGFAHYCATKAAVHAFVKSVAREVAPFGITVNAVAPGPTDTPLLRTLPGEALDALRGQVPLGRFADVEEIVPTALMLACDDGSFYTGAILSPCGGHVMP